MTLWTLPMVILPLMRQREFDVSLARPLDREIRDSYILTVRAIDQGVPPLSSTTQLTVTVSD